MAISLRHLDRTAGRVEQVSRLYRTPPWGRTDQPDFLNCCASLDTSLDPADLLALCLETERMLHRVRDVRWGPRTIDIDILDMPGQRIDTQALTLPHPQAHRRAFVLVPLLEIAPDVELAGRAGADWLHEVDASAIQAETTDGMWWCADA